MTTPKPGWYPDPAGTDELFRWWDGQTWADAISETAKAPAPATVRPVVDPSEEPHLGKRSPRRVLVALTLGLAVFVTAGLGFGAAFLRADDETSPPIPPEPAQRATSTQAPMGQVDEWSGQAQIGDVSMVLPQDPYEIFGGSVTVPGAFDIFFASNAIVHRSDNGFTNWSATVAFAHVPARVAIDRDLESASKKAIAGIADKFFGGHQVEVEDFSAVPIAVDGHAAIRVSANVSYSIKNLASTYDEVTVILVQLDDGSSVAAISSVPNDADQQLHRMAAQSLRTLKIS